MAMVERRHRSVQDELKNQRTSRRIVRLAAIGCVSLLLLGSAYQASFATSGQQQAYEDDDGLSDGEIAGIGAGVVVVGAAAGGTTASGNASMAQALPADAEVSALRLVPGSSMVKVGACRSYDLQARARDGRWYSVTNRGDATIEMRDPDQCIMKQEGSKNTFCVPVTAQNCNGRSFVLVGMYSPPGRPAMSAEARLTVQGVATVR